MGTNYYMHKKSACPYCGHRPEPLHIGRSAVGWVFMLHVTFEYPTLSAWVSEWDKPGVTIEDECGRPITPERMLRIITCRGGNLLRPSDAAHGDWMAGDGTYDYSSSDFS